MTVSLYNDLASQSKRLKQNDLLSTDDAAKLIGTSRVTIYAWINRGRCIGLTQVTRGFKIPRWQFEPTVWPWIEKISAALGNNDGWDILSYLESPQDALGGVSPKELIEQGQGNKVLSQLKVA